MPQKAQDISEPAPGLAPLDAIRQEEAANARRIIQARQQAETILQNARQQAEQMIQQARQSGRRDGEQESAQKIAGAQREAEHTLAEARAKAEALRYQASPLVEPSAEWAEGIILGRERGSAKP